MLDRCLEELTVKYDRYSFSEPLYVEHYEEPQKTLVCNDNDGIRLYDYVGRKVIIIDDRMERDFNGNGFNGMTILMQYVNLLNWEFTAYNAEIYEYCK